MIHLGPVPGGFSGLPGWQLYQWSVCPACMTGMADVNGTMCTHTKAMPLTAQTSTKQAWKSPVEGTRPTVSSCPDRAHSWMDRQVRFRNHQLASMVVCPVWSAQYSLMKVAFLIKEDDSDNVMPFETSMQASQVISHLSAQTGNVV